MSGVLIVSFALFAVEQAGAASDAQRRKLETTQSPAPSEGSELRRENRHGSPREYLEDANDLLVSPFTPLVDGQGVWVQRMITGFLGLVLYGVLLAMGANYLRKS